MTFKILMLYNFCMIIIINIYYLRFTYSLLQEDGHVIEYDSFEQYIKFNNKSYSHFYDENRSRVAFEENNEIVREHNKLFKTGKTSFRLRPNIMADKNSNTYLKSYLRLLQSKRLSFDNDLNSEMVGSSIYSQTPEEIDWRQKGFDTVSDNQLTCGSCYAFSIAESLAGQIFKRTGHVLSLSPQQIVDCSVAHGNRGCTGGSLQNTLKYLQDTGGLMREKDYKYVSKNGRCQFVKELAVVNISSWAILPAKDEKAIEAAVAHIGPIAVSINATPKTFQLYSDGIYDDHECSSATVNHAMMVLGFTKDYWILKNWWGESWGEKGYMRIRKGKNLCGMANYAAYAVV